MAAPSSQPGHDRERQRAKKVQSRAMQYDEHNVGAERVQHAMVKFTTVHDAKIKVSPDPQQRVSAPSTRMLPDVAATR